MFSFVVNCLLCLISQGSLGRAFGKKVKDELQNSKIAFEYELDSPKEKKRTSAPIVVDGDDIPDQIKELDKAIELAANS